MTDFFMPPGKFDAGHKGICFISYADPTSVVGVLQSAPHAIAQQEVVVDLAAPREASGAEKGAGAAAGAFASYGPAAGAGGQAQAAAGQVKPGRLFLTQVS